MIEEQEVSQEYTAGWSSNVETEYLGKGLSEETIRLISDKNDEPEWLLEWRLKAFAALQTMKEPNWAEVDYPKIKYDESAVSASFLPTMLRLGGGFDFILDSYNKVSVTAEFSKLLVPTPPLLGTFTDYNDDNGNGIFDEEEEQVGLPYTGIISGKPNDVDFLAGVFQSFSDAPGGFSEELREFTWSLGAEYTYEDSFALRAGFFNESEDKGARKFLALGAGFKFTGTNIDLSYLFSASKVPSPLENTLRFSLTFNFGDNEYYEY